MRVAEPHFADKTLRLALPRRSSPWWLPLRRGLALGYRQGVAEGAWLVKTCEPGNPDSRSQGRLGFADDKVEADGSRVLDFETARAKALKWKPDPDATSATFGATLANPTTVQDAVLAHLTWLEKQGKSVTRSRSMADCHISGQPLAQIRLQDLRYAHIDDWRNDIAGSIRKNRRLKPGEDPRLPLDDSAEIQEERRARQCTANRVTAFLKSALNRAEAVGQSNHDPLWDRIDPAAWRRVKLVQGVYRARQRFLSIEEQQALVRACPADLRQLVQAALVTGARFSELAKMKVENAHLLSSTIALSTSKTKVRREIPILHEAQKFIQELMKGRPKGELLFVKADGSRWGTNHYVRPLQTAVLEAGIDAVCFHELRHTFASTMIMAGVTPAALAKALGHKTVKMVLETYGHLRADWATEEVLAKAPRLGIFRTGRKAAGK